MAGKRTTALSEGDIYARIVASSCDHRLPPGTKLVEERLATAFGVSRTCIRPVLVRLANGQTVTLSPHRGAPVAQPPAKEAREAAAPVTAGIRSAVRAAHGPPDLAALFGAG